MSFMNSGAECSTSTNPLAQFTKHTAEDRSLQHERVGPAGPQGPMGMRSQGHAMSAEDQQMMDRFQQQGPQAAGPAFQFEQMHREMNNLQNQSMGPGPAGQASWVNDFKSSPSPALEEQARMNGAAANSQWASEFSTAKQPQQQQQGPGMAMNMNMGMNQGFGYSRFGGGGSMFMNRPMMHQQQPMMQQDQQPKVQELDSKNWEEQFRQIEEQDKKQEQSKGKGKETLVEDEKSQIIVDEDGEEFHMEYTDDAFESVWEKIKTQVLDGDDWTSKDAWDRDFDEFTTNRPEFGDYKFEENNPYLNEEDPYSMGCSLMDTGAKLSVAVLCFEAAVQKDQNHVDAWARLGAAQAQNEKENPAIRALERCVQLDPTNLDALMNLSVSYTNEAWENAAYATLEKWLSMKYPDITSQARSQEPSLGNEDKFQLHSRVTELFIRAAQISPDGASMDADVQVGLGVLFYGNEDFEKAIDCFNAALTVRPNDALLWNRLGATLANSSRSEEAIEAYYKALELRPAFVRARYNLGVSCINIGCYKEAAQHLLAALSLHDTEQGSPNDEDEANKSTNLYDTLRRVFLAMERRDLVEKVGTGMNINDFRAEFEF